MSFSDAERVRYAPLIEGLRAAWRDEATSSEDESGPERPPASSSSSCVFIHGGLVSVPNAGGEDAFTVHRSPAAFIDLGNNQPDSVGFIDDDDDKSGGSQPKNAAEVEATEKVTTTTETVIQTTTTKTMTTTVVLSDDDDEMMPPQQSKNLPPSSNGENRPRIVLYNLTALGRPIIDGIQSVPASAKEVGEEKMVEQVIHTSVHEDGAGRNTKIPVIFEENIKIPCSVVMDSAEETPIALEKKCRNFGVEKSRESPAETAGGATNHSPHVIVRDSKVEDEQETPKAIDMMKVAGVTPTLNAQRLSAGVDMPEMLITCNRTTSAPSVEEGAVGRLQTDAVDAVVSVETTNSPKTMSATTSALSTENAAVIPPLPVDDLLAPTLDFSSNRRTTASKKQENEPTCIVNEQVTEHSSIVVPLQHHTTARVSTTATVPSVVGPKSSEEAEIVRNLFAEYQTPNVAEKPLIEDVILEEAELDEDGEPPGSARRDQSKVGGETVKLFPTHPPTASSAVFAEKSSARSTAADCHHEASELVINSMETRTYFMERSSSTAPATTITAANVSAIGPGSFTQQYAEVTPGHRQQQQRLEHHLLQELSASPPLVCEVQSAADDGQRPSSSAEYTRRVEVKMEHPRPSEYSTTAFSEPTADEDKQHQQIPRQNANKVASDFKMFDDIYDDSVQSRQQNPRADPLKMNPTTTSTTVIHRTITDYYPNGGGTVDLASFSSQKQEKMTTINALNGVGPPTSQAGNQFLAVEIPFHTASDRSTPRSQLSIASSVSSTQQQQQPPSQSNPSKSPTPTFGSLHRKNLLQNQYQISPQDLSPRTLSRINHLNVIVEKNQKDGADVIHHHPVFVKDTSKYWYKPTISREEAINMLKHKPPGTFVVRDSNSFPGAFGLALKVARPPAGVDTSIAADRPPADGSPELVRHFLIEPSPKGVKLKGCANEPVFGTLAALVYQHSITPLALPCKLLLPDYDPALVTSDIGAQPTAGAAAHLNSNQALLERGAACNVTYLCSLDTESLTGPEALRRAASYGFDELARGTLRAIPVHFKVSSQGITLTDNTRTLFFRRHYPATLCTFAGIDPESRTFDNNHCCQLPPSYVRHAPVFGFVARKFTSGPNNGENACHVFAELDPEQPASAVVRFITNVMMPQARSLQHHQQQQPASTTMSSRGGGQR